MFDDCGKTMVRTKKPRTQTGLRLEPEMFERLRNSPRGLSNEIRDRIERTFREDALDPVTGDLQYAVTWMSDELTRQAGRPWHASRKGREALAAAIETWLALSAKSIGDAEDPFGPDDPPTLGRSIARHFQRHVFEMRKTMQLLRGERNP